MWSLLTIILVICNVDGQSESTPLSPCPNVFNYEMAADEDTRWYGTITITTDVTLQGLWLSIALDAKADIIGNWDGEVTSKDNINFKIENPKKKIEPGSTHNVRFFVKYHQLSKAPKVRIIKLNGRVICNANNSLPAIDRPPNSEVELISEQAEDSKSNTPASTQEWSEPNQRPPEAVMIFSPHNDPRPDDVSVTRSFQDGLSNTDSFRSATQNPPFDVRNVRPFNIGDQMPSQDVTPNAPSLPISSYDDQNDQENNTPGPEDDYGFGGLLSRAVAGGADPFYKENDNEQQQIQCGQVLRPLNPNSPVAEGKSTMEGQWPWHVALYRAKTVNSEYACGGTLISQLHVITAAHCVTHKWSRRMVNKNILTLHLGKHNLRASTQGAQIRFVNKITVHDEYDPMTFQKDAGILELREKVQFTPWVQPVCLWPENQIDLSNIIGKGGIVVGWGFTSKHTLNEELTLVKMPIVDQESCVNSYRDFFSMYTSEYSYCAGSRNGSSPCKSDSGGGMVLYAKGSWYLRGIATLAVRVPNEYRCDPSHYVVFTDLAKLLPWIKKTIFSIV